MKATVDEKGLFIPRELLGDAREVEIVKSGNKLIVGPLSKKVEAAPPKSPSIWDLGSSPTDIGIADGSVNHDKYLAEEACGRSSSTPAS